MSAHLLEIVVHPERVIPCGRPKIARENALSLVACESPKDFFSRDVDSQTPKPVLDYSRGQRSFSAENQGYALDDHWATWALDYADPHFAPPFLMLSILLTSSNSESSNVDEI